MDADVRGALETLEARLETLLPETYRNAYEEVQPISMGSAALKYDADGRVAWDEIWGSFCDLALAGGPPHKGTLLEPGSEAEIDAQLDRYDEVAEEICRGIKLVTGLRAYVAPDPGWVSVTCSDDGMAGWLVRAIVTENVAARRRGAILEVPAAPHFRLEKEIKNVVTVVAKTCHYWVGHMPRSQQQAIAEAIAGASCDLPFIEPDRSGPNAASGLELAATLAARIHHDTGLRDAPSRYAAWVGIECPSIRFAVWMMRALVASNVLARREDVVLFVPVNGVTDPSGTIVASAVASVYRCARERGVS